MALDTALSVLSGADVQEFLAGHDFRAIGLSSRTKNMIFFESLDCVAQLVDSHLSSEVGREILGRSQPAIAIRTTEEETDSWLYGNAMLGEDVDWPTVNGRALEHTARISLDGLPRILPQQPGNGYLSFFDGFPWIKESGYDLADYGRVIYDDGQSVREHRCPLAPSDDYYPGGQQYVTAEGPYWTIPTHDEISKLPLEHDPEAYQEFSNAITTNVIGTYFYGQLFGRPAPIQADITPEPRFDPKNDRHADDEWIHLASFREPSTVFDCYFAVPVKDLARRTFNNVVFGAQC